MPLIHIDHPNIPAEIKAAFAGKVAAIAKQLSIDPNWLMQVMYAESRLKATAQNIQQGRLIAAGLLQWTKASGVYGAPSGLLRLNHLQQLDKVLEYFRPYAGRMHSYFDVYLATFFPAAIGKSDDYVFATGKLPASVIARQNPAVNINKDGLITMSEFRQYVWNSTPERVRGLVFATKQIVAKVTEKTTAIITKIDDDTSPIAKATGGIATVLAFFFLSAI